MDLQGARRGLARDEIRLARGDRFRAAGQALLYKDLGSPSSAPPPCQGSTRRDGRTPTLPMKVGSKLQRRTWRAA